MKAHPRRIATSLSRHPVSFTNCPESTARVKTKFCLFWVVFVIVLLVAKPSQASTLTSVNIGGSMIGGSTQTLTGTLTIARTSSSDDQGSIQVSMSYGGDVLGPGIVVVLAGQTSVSFTVNAPSVVSQEQTGTITGSLGAQASATVLIEPFQLSLNISGNIVGGSTQTATATVTLNAPSNGQYVTMSSNNSGLSISSYNLVIGEDGQPTATSLQNLYDYVSSHYGHDSHVTATYVEDADYQQIVDFARQRMRDKNRKRYNLLNNNCKTFAKDAIQEGLK